MNESNAELFERWFVNPLSKLEKIPNGDGGFIALATSCFLYERYAKAYIKESGKKANRDALLLKFQSDFGTDTATAEAFWDIIRDGIMHQGMPKQSNCGGKNLPGYIFHHSFVTPVELSDWGGELVLKINPWELMWKIIGLCNENIDLISNSNSFPFPKIL